MGMDKAKSCAKITMGERAGAPGTRRLRWENLGQEELQNASLFPCRV